MTSCSGDTSSSAVTYVSGTDFLSPGTISVISDSSHNRCRAPRWTLQLQRLVPAPHISFLIHFAKLSISRILYIPHTDEHDSRAGADHILSPSPHHDECKQECFGTAAYIHRRWRLGDILANGNNFEQQFTGIGVLIVNLCSMWLLIGFSIIMAPLSGPLWLLPSSPQPYLLACVVWRRRLQRQTRDRKLSPRDDGGQGLQERPHDQPTMSMFSDSTVSFMPTHRSDTLFLGISAGALPTSTILVLST